MRTPLDNIIVILLGAILSRAVLGSSPFWHVIVAATVLALLHRCCGRILLRYPSLARIIEGEKILLYEQGEFLRENMNRTEVSHEDIMLAIRKTLKRESLEGILRIYIERNGSLTIIREEKASLSASAQDRQQA